VSAALPIEWRPPTCWPVGAQIPLLDALLATERGTFESALARWSVSVKLDDIDPASFRVLPQLARRLEQFGIDHPDRARLNGVRKQTWARNRLLFDATLPLLDALKSRGVDVLALKGVPMVCAVYRDLAARGMDDVDIAVPVNQFEIALKTLVECGYTLDRAPLPTDPANGHGENFRGPDRTHFVDWHWHVLRGPRPADSDAQFFAHAEPLDFFGRALKMPDPAALLFQVLIHGVQYNPLAPLRFLLDAAAIVRSRAIDWPRLAMLAHTHHERARTAAALRWLKDHGVTEVEPGWRAVTAAPPITFDRLKLEYAERPAQGDRWTRLDRWRALWSRQRERHGSSINAALTLPAALREQWRLPTGLALLRYGLRRALTRSAKTSSP
jgi:hypothetical protein